MILIGQSLLSGSKGQMKEVPRLIGQSEDLAVEMIRDAGFVPNIIYENNALVNATIVITQDPLPTEKLVEGGEIKITVSMGQEMIAVPNVLNRDYAEAASLIEQMGLKVGQRDPRRVRSPQRLCDRAGPRSW